MCSHDDVLCHHNETTDCRLWVKTSLLFCHVVFIGVCYSTIKLTSVDVWGPEEIHESLLPIFLAISIANMWEFHVGWAKGSCASRALLLKQGMKSQSLEFRVLFCHMLPPLDSPKKRHEKVGVVEKTPQWGSENLGHNSTSATNLTCDCNKHFNLPEPKCPPVTEWY